MKLLAFDTCADACSVALSDAGAVTETHDLAPREQAQRLLPAIHALMAAAGWEFADLDAIAFGRGPGSFTGVRVAAAVCQGLAFGHDLPVVPVSSLEALALGAGRRHGAQRVLAGFDARMQEIYLGVFAGDAGGWRSVQAETVAPAETVALPAEGTWLGAGSAFARYEAVLRQRLGVRLAATAPDALPRAGDIARLAAPRAARGETVAAEQAVPVYLRDRVAAVPARARR